MTVSDPSKAPAALSLIGHLSEYKYLLTALDEQPGLLPLIADPFSGTTRILQSTLVELRYRALYIDARPLANGVDLAMEIADTAVGDLRPAALAWWRGTAPLSDVEGTRLRRDLAASGVDTLALQRGEGFSPGQLLELSLRVALLLADGPLAVAIDHLDDLLGRGRPGRHDTLGTLRTARQRDPNLQLVLVGRPAGALHLALDDPAHPMYQAGRPQLLKRTPADRFVSDLAIGKPRLPDGTSVKTVGILAELAAGVPAYVWSLVDQLAAAPEPPAQAWERYCREREGETARHIATLGALHPLAIPALTATATGLGAYALPYNDGRIRAALHTLRAGGAIWQPRTREWAMANPLLASWLRHHASPSIARRARAATGTRA